MIFIYFLYLFYFRFFDSKGHDPSPHEFPIFNVSHNPSAPYPNPINHLYDRRYKEAYSTFIKQNQAAAAAAATTTATPTPSSKNEPSTPTSPQPTTNPATSQYSTHSQGPFQRQSSKPPPPPPFHQQPNIGWQYVNPYATMPRSHAAYYQQQAAKLTPTTQGQINPNTTTTHPVRRSSTGEDIRSNSLSRSASSNELNYSTNSTGEKIRVRVINDNSSTNPQINTLPNAQRSILKPNIDTQDNNGPVTTRTIYAAPNTTIGNETIQDLFKVVDKQGSGPPGSTGSPMTERVIIIDRRGPNSSDNTSSSSGVDRYRAFEIRTSTTGATPSTPSATTTTTTTANTNNGAQATPTTSTPSNAYAMQQQNFYPGQQLFYQQPKVYSSVPGNLYLTTPYGTGAPNFFGYGYYPY